MAMLRGLKECARLKGVGFVHVGSFGQEPNWFARPLPIRISEACRRAFVTSLAKVRKEFDLLFHPRFGTERSTPPTNNGGSRPIGSIPAFIGLIIVMPVLGHATWHLYRKVLP